MWKSLLLALALLPGLAAPTAAQGAGASPSGAVAPPGPSAEIVKRTQSMIDIGDEATELIDKIWEQVMAQ